MAPSTASRVINQGNSSGVSFDQRGKARPFDFGSITNATNGDGSDIGAFELNPSPLGIAPSAGGTVLFWPTYASGFRLEYAPSVTNPASWTATNVTPTAVGNQFYVTNGPPAGSRFFHLIFP